MHNHEKDNGRGKTSSLAYSILGFDENGIQVLPERFDKVKKKN